MNFRTLTQAPPLRGVRVILRADLNLPFERGKVGDDFRLQQILPTIMYLIKAGARTTLISHRGEESESLRPIADRLSQFMPVSFANDFKELTDLQKKSEPGSVILLENIRKFPGEIENKESFSRQLSHFGDIYVNEAFSASHRAHASIVGVPKYLESFAGFLFENEVVNLSKALKPTRPALFILGGAKISTKLPLIEKFLKTYDSIFVGGAMANDFYVHKGFSVGQSLVSDTVVSLEKAMKHSGLVLPADVVVTGVRGVSTKEPQAVSADERIVDAGQETITKLRSLISRAKFILWNGPIGMYESGFQSGSEGIARAIAASNAFSIVGGGDTAALIHQINLKDRFGFLSTAGGAMLDFLANETLPGIEALSVK